MKYIPIDERDPATVRAVILARTSDTGAKVQKLDSQVQACTEFVAQYGWQLLNTFIEKKSGYRKVKRPVLEQIERMIQEQAIDVVVATELERVSRTAKSQLAALHHAERYGAEYRFVEFKDHAGKLPEGVEASAYLMTRQLYGEMERNKIKERTERGRATRAAKRIPSGGQGGAPYGYTFDFLQKDGQRKTSHIGLKINEYEAGAIRLMFQLVDETEISVRALAVELNRRGYVTRVGGRWTVKTVMDKLRNPLYCGKGRVLKWQATWKTERDEQTGEVFEVSRMVRRSADESYLAAEGTNPAIIEEVLFERVQQKLSAQHWHAGRLNRANSPHQANDTLLNGGFVRCAHCGSSMSRFWRKRKNHPDVPYYRCIRSGNDPAHTCKTHLIVATEVDNLVLRLIAFALADPDKILELAEASEPHYQQAVETGNRLASRIMTLRSRLDTIKADRRRYQQEQSRLDPKRDTTIFRAYQQELERLNNEQAEIEGELTEISPQQTMAADRAAMLRALMQHRSYLIDFLHGTVTPQGKATLPHSLHADDVARLLGEPSPGEQYNAWRVEQGMCALTQDRADAATRDMEVSTYEVMYDLLQQVPAERLRALLRNWGVVVKVTRPRGKEYGATSVNERVVVEWFTRGQAALKLSASDTKDTILV